MATVHSYLGRVELQSDGVSGSAGYDHLDFLGDARLRIQRTETVVSRRGTQFKTSEVGQAKVELTGAITYDDSDATVALVTAAAMANTHLGVKFLDKASGEGFTSDMKVTSYEHAQDEDAGQIVNVTMVPYYVDTDPAWA